MTKNIRKAAPEGAEYFRITVNCIEYAKLDEDDRLHIWQETNGKWLAHPVNNFGTPSECGFHAFEAPKWIWFAFGGLFGAVVVSLICGLVEAV
jgi:hypothetical protein